MLGYIFDISFAENKAHGLLSRLHLKGGLFWNGLHSNMHEMDSNENPQAEYWKDLHETATHVFSKLKE